MRLASGSKDEVTAETLATWGIRNWLPAVAKAQHGLDFPAGTTLEVMVTDMAKRSSVISPQSTPGVVSAAVRGILLEACQAVLEGRKPETGGDDHRLAIVREYARQAAHAAYSALLVDDDPGRRT